MIFVTAAVGFFALSGCGGEDDTATSGRSTPASTTAMPVPSTTTAQAPSTTGPPTTTAAATPTTRTNSPSSTAPGRAVDGFVVDYPPGWRAGDLVQATAFATGATCGSAVIVDRAPPNLAGPGASIEQSFVQVCWRALDGRTLQAFMNATYGTTGGFQATTLAGRPAFVSRAGTSSTWFVDTTTRRYQVVTAVATTPALEATRLAEVERILKSLSLSG